MGLGLHYFQTNPYDDLGVPHSRKPPNKTESVETPDAGSSENLEENLQIWVGFITMFDTQIDQNDFLLRVTLLFSKFSHPQGHPHPKNDSHLG